MCECCQQPQKLKKEPKDCTSEQIKECHGDENNHPCTGHDDSCKDKHNEEGK